MYGPGRPRDRPRLTVHFRVHVCVYGHRDCILNIGRNDHTLNWVQLYELKIEVKAQQHVHLFSVYFSEYLSTSINIYLGKSEPHLL